MNILIIENVWIGKGKYGFFDKTLLNSFSILPTLYARQIAAITPKKHKVTLVNERYSKIDFEKSYDLVNINFTTSTSKRAYEIAKKFRENNAKVVLSGMHPSAVPKESIRYADSVQLGRGENNWNKLLDDFEKNNLKKFYKPISYKKISIPPTNLQLPGFVFTGAIEATRGCPYGCNFCPEAKTNENTKFYKRPIDDVIDELKEIKQKTVMFYDASLTIDIDYTKSLFNEMMPLKKKFFCNGNVNVLANDREFVELSKKAGCLSWLVGFESVSQETINSVGKTTNKVDEYIRAVDNIHNNKMTVIGDFMFGFDKDKKNVFSKTLKMIKDLKIDVADFCILTPFPGTKIYEKLIAENRILTKDWSKYNLKNVVFKPKNMNAEELTIGVRKMYKEFYSTPYTSKRILKSLKLGVYPFFLIMFRNIIANMNSKKLYIE